MQHHGWTQSKCSVSKKNVRVPVYTILGHSVVTKQITGCLEIEGQDLGDGNCRRDMRKLGGSRYVHSLDVGNSFVVAYVSLPNCTL